MKKNDLLTVIGILAGLAMMYFGIVTGKGTLNLFIDYPSMFITLGGSFCSLLINFPISEIKRLPAIILKSTKNMTVSKNELIQIFIEMSRKARREGLLSLEDDIVNLKFNFITQGLQMVIDSVEPDTIKEIKEIEIDEMDKRHSKGIAMISAWGAYAPAYGMIGTLIGLIIMLANLSDSSAIASGMAAALITTFYGALLANLLFNPMAAKLALKNEIEIEITEMMLEGILSIQSGVNPRIMEEKLLCFLSPSEKLKYKKDISKDDGGPLDGEK